MAKAFSKIDLAIPAADVWQLIGGFGSLPDWLPYIPQSELHEGGRVRHLANPDGSMIVERLMAFDEEGRSYSYNILRSPFPQKDYLATLSVKDIDGGKGARVEWSGEFKPVGISDEEVSKLFQGIYDDGLKALKAHYVQS